MNGEGAGAALASPLKIDGAGALGAVLDSSLFFTSAGLPKKNCGLFSGTAGGAAADAGNNELTGAGAVVEAGKLNIETGAVEVGALGANKEGTDAADPAEAVPVGAGASAGAGAATESLGIFSSLPARLVLPDLFDPKIFEVAVPPDLRGEKILLWPTENPVGARFGTALPNKLGTGFTPLVCSFNGFLPSSVGFVCS